MNQASPEFPFAHSAAPPVGTMLGTLLACLAIDAAIIVYCLDDRHRRMPAAGDTARFWTAVIILGGPLGQMAYWLYGRGDTRP